MRTRTAISAIVVGLAMTFSSVALADKAHKDDVRIKKVDRDSTARWDRGDWTASGSSTTALDRRSTHSSAGTVDSGVTGRHYSGPYRYFFTDRQGKYDYFLDRYDYPYEYGAREMDLPVGVLGFVPPQEIGGGPVRYYRNERPLSWSIYDTGAGALPR